jgi:hypothetical protein
MDDRAYAESAACIRRLAQGGATRGVKPARVGGLMTTSRQWIAICGTGPVNFTLNDPSKPPWREV